MSNLNQLNNILKFFHSKYNTAKGLLKLRLKPPVFIFQMGKVASTSIYKSLQQQYPGRVFHGHSFKKDHENPEIRFLHHHYRFGGRIKIISLVREPVGRNISAFFQNFEEYTGIPFSSSALSLDELYQIFLGKYAHEEPLEWFDRYSKHFLTKEMIEMAQKKWERCS